MTRTFRLVVHRLPNEPDASGDALAAAAGQLGLTGVAAIRPGRLFYVAGELSPAEARRMAGELLVDPVTETLKIDEVGANGVEPALSAGQALVDVTFHPGVTDPAAENLVRSARLLGLDVQRAATGRTFQIAGVLPQGELRRLAETVLSNPVIQQATLNRPAPPPFVDYPETDGLVEVISLTEAGPEELTALSAARRLSLDLAEMEAIQAYYRVEGREPTDVELEMLAQTWSEHCVHKTFKALIDYTGPDGETITVDGILNAYIRAATEQIDKPWVKSAFVDNAGIIAFNDGFDLAFKVETHNHPSALEPFGGANTGVGGVIRDVLGVSARPIATTDVLCFGPQDMKPADLPAGVLHPARVQAGVIAGVEDYGNKMGIPTVNGALVYDPGYTANPLVFCGCLGILPADSHRTGARPGDRIVALGGRTGRDGLRGATFSSMEMDISTSEIAGTAVQIGHPIMEKQVQEVILQARDEALYSAITDCGAGGFSSAVGEMSDPIGARVQLADIRVKYPGLRPWELWLSEAQERMVLAVPPEKLDRLQALCAVQDVELTDLGEFTGDGRLEIYDGGRLVGQVSEAFLHDGIPRRRLQAVWQPAAANRPPTPYRQDPAAALLALLAHPNIRSREDTIRLYDHEVQGGTAVKPLVGRSHHGPGDGAVLVPLDTQFAALPGANGAPAGPMRGAALANGICPQFAAVDPYHMAWSAVDEAVRNAVAVGADPDQIAILDNFCWGNPGLPDRLGALVRCAQGCHDAAVAYGTPFVSGKDSLNNEYTGADGEKHAIPGTLLISALGIVPDVEKTATMPFKQAGDLIYVLGTTRNELAGSHYGALVGLEPAHSRPPAPAAEALALYRALHQALLAGLVTAVHDCSEGGLAVALAEMALAGGLGGAVDLAGVPADPDLTADQRLFSESLARLVVTVPPDRQAAFEALLGELPCGLAGLVTDNSRFIVADGDRPLFDLPVADLDRAFRGHTRSSRPESLPPNPSIGTAAGRIEMPALRRAPRVLILHANGTNRDRDAALACRLGGGDPEIVHINQLLSGERRLLDYGMLVVPGGFSYGDDLGAGVLWAADLRHLLGDPLARFVAGGRPVLGICNGFQVLVKSGLLSGDPAEAGRRPFTLTYNASGRFECRWVLLEPNPASHCLFTRGLSEPIVCPVAHGEGRFAVRDAEVVDRLVVEGRITLTYAGAGYPANPNGSAAGIAGICSPSGTVMGLMPHPEDHVFPWQHPEFHEGARGNLGLGIFQCGIKEA